MHISIVQLYVKSCGGVAINAHSVAVWRAAANLKWCIPPCPAHPPPPYTHTQGWMVLFLLRALHSAWRALHDELYEQRFSLGRRLKDYVPPPSGNGTVAAGVATDGGAADDAAAVGGAAVA